MFGPECSVLGFDLYVVHSQVANGNANGAEGHQTRVGQSSETLGERTLHSSDSDFGPLGVSIALAPSR